jgi:PAS domain S-box-containing protein
MAELSAHGVGWTATLLLLLGGLALAWREVLRARREAARAARLQGAIEASAGEWQLTFDTVESPLIVADPSGHVRRLNRAASELAGKVYREVLGLPVEDIAAGEPWQSAASLVAAVEASRSSHSLSVPDAATGRTWDLSASRAEAADGVRIILVARDVTGIVRLQESLRRSELTSAMGSLVGGVAHEVRNPLFGISAALDAFESRFGDREEYRRYLYVLRSQLRRLNDLMHELLEYGKPPRLDVAPVALAEVVAEAVGHCSALAARRGVAVATRVDPVLPALPMDRGRIVQVFQNLLENSLQHAPEGGRVEVEAGPAAADGGWAVCQVRDSGPGFQPEDLARVFEPFFTRRRDGTGLGLSIVHRIVEQHGGRITAGNLPQGGAVMELRLPLAPAPAVLR